MAGKMFGRYRLVRLLARGGMAEVYLAILQGAAGFEKRLVIKKILPIYEDLSEFTELFTDEARISVGLNHTHIVQVFDAGVVDGEHFIAMEYVDGPDLEKVLVATRKLRRQVSIDAVLYIATRVASALDYAHTRLDPSGHPLCIVHRDISPPNILLSVQADVKLTDFGVAKYQQRASSSRPGVIRGKYAYMSPEQLRGQAIDSRSDLFSLGTVLYEMLTGENPFLGETDYQTMEAVVAAQPRNILELRPDTPRDLMRVVGTCLAPDIGQRYQRADSVRRDLAELMFNRGVIDDPVLLLDELWGLFPRQLSRRGQSPRSKPASRPRASTPGSVAFGAPRMQSGVANKPRQNTLSPSRPGARVVRPQLRPSMHGEEDLTIPQVGNPDAIPTQPIETYSHTLESPPLPPGPAQLAPAPPDPMERSRPRRRGRVQRPRIEFREKTPPGGFVGTDPALRALGIPGSDRPAISFTEVLEADPASESLDEALHGDPASESLDEAVEADPASTSLDEALNAADLEPPVTSYEGEPVPAAEASDGVEEAAAPQSDPEDQALEAGPDDGQEEDYGQEPSVEDPDSLGESEPPEEEGEPDPSEVDETEEADAPASEDDHGADPTDDELPNDEAVARAGVSSAPPAPGVDPADVDETELDDSASPSDSEEGDEEEDDDGSADSSGEPTSDPSEEDGDERVEADLDSSMHEAPPPQEEEDAPDEDAAAQEDAPDEDAAAQEDSEDEPGDEDTGEPEGSADEAPEGGEEAPEASPPGEAEAGAASQPGAPDSSDELPPPPSERHGSWAAPPEAADPPSFPSGVLAVPIPEGQEIPETEGEEPETTPGSRAPGAQLAPPPPALLDDDDDDELLEWRSRDGSPWGVIIAALLLFAVSFAFRDKLTPQPVDEGETTEQGEEQTEPSPEEDPGSAALEAEEAEDSSALSDEGEQAETTATDDPGSEEADANLEEEPTEADAPRSQAASTTSRSTSRSSRSTAPSVRVSLTSEPPGARLTVNGRFVGTAPKDVRVRADRILEVSASLDGYMKTTQMIQVEGEDRSAVVALSPASTDAEPPASGILELTSKPWAYVTIDGRVLGRITPVRLELPAGEHVITLENPQTSWRDQRTVTIVADDTTTLMIER